MSAKPKVIHEPTDRSKLLIILCSNGSKLVISTIKKGRAGIVYSQRLDLKRIGGLIDYAEYCQALDIGHKAFKIDGIPYKPMSRRSWASHHCQPASIPHKKGKSR